jgi:SAM-dependent methyltransferase
MKAIALLKESIIKLDSSELKFPFHDSHPDLVIVIDSHEYLVDPYRSNLEIARISRNNGKLVIFVPNGNEQKLALKIEDFVISTKEEYGHIQSV